MHKSEGWCCCCADAGMLNEADVYMGQLRATLKQREMWDNSLIVYSSGALS